ncbi:MAG: LssY C-terminal domain-containing protein [Thermoguttaceae bacterium]
MKLVASLICLVGFISPAFGVEVQSALDDAPRVTVTKTGIQGDPINVGLIGTKDELIAAMVAAKWQPADPITFKSSVELVKSVVLHRPDETAPVSNLYLWNRKEDLAFEQEVGKDASRRHHVRFWQSAQQVDGRPLWLGAATFDTKVGLSRVTRLITHHIDANIDADRDKLLSDLTAAGWLLSTEGIDFQIKRDGRNGGGDPYHTDGKLSLGVLQGR